MAEEKSTRELFFPDLYFSHGNRRIDYIIVYSMKNILSSRRKKEKFANFIEYLERINIHMEQSRYSRDPDIIFVKIHIPHEILEGYADAINIDLFYKTPTIPVIHKVSIFKCQRNALSYNDAKSPIYNRAKKTISREHPKKITQAERILITYTLLEEVPFGEGVSEKGLRALQSKGILNDFYPLHEGPTVLTPTGPLTDRQLLSVYWGDFSNFFKTQPIEIVQHYFGTELAFFVAFVSFCNNMLLIASILSILFFVFGYALEEKYLQKIRKDLCESKDYVCPACDPKICKISPLKNFCNDFINSHYFDNVGTFFLSIFMSFWGTLVFELWTKKRNFLFVKWNLGHIEFDVRMRPTYEEHTDVLVISPITGKLEPTMSNTYLTWRYILISLMMLSLIAIVLFFVLLAIAISAATSKFITMYVTLDFVITHKGFILKCLASTVQVIFIILIDDIRVPAVRYMTDLENCRTQFEYENSYILKFWILSFFNDFTAIFYTGFLKGYHYTNPGDEGVYHLFSFKSNLCGLAGCTYDLSLFLTFYLIIRTFLWNCVSKVFFPLAKHFFRKKGKVEESFRKKPQWERDYELKKLTEMSIQLEYGEIMEKMTIVIFLSAVFPFVPVLVYACNFVESRVDANSYSIKKRRPMPRKFPGLGVWYYIFHFIIILGVIINALFAVLAKDYLMILYHMYIVGSLDNYLDNKFSKFGIKDYGPEARKNQIEGIEYCLYNRPFRYPYNDPKKYEIRRDFLPFVLYSAVFIVVYQHVVFCLSRLFSKFIPNTSADAEEYINLQQAKEKKMLRTIRNASYLFMKKHEKKNSLQ